MSSFDTIPFSVIPDGSFFPTPEKDVESGIVSYRADIQVANASRRNSLMTRLTAVTFKRPLGTTVANAHIDAGTGARQLIVPSFGGTLKTYTQAILVELSDIKGYGREKIPTFQMNARWVIISEWNV